MTNWLYEHDEMLLVKFVDVILLFECLLYNLIILFLLLFLIVYRLKKKIWRVYSILRLYSFRKI